MAEALYRSVHAKKIGGALAQNVHIADGYDKLNDALVELMASQIAVLTVHIGDHRPQITVQYNAQCDKLPNQHATRIVTNAEGRFEIFAATIHECRVQWTRPYF